MKGSFPIGLPHDRTKMRRLAGVASAALLAIIPISAARAQSNGPGVPEAESVVTIHVAGTAGQVNQTPFFAAQRLGYFKAAHLDVQFATLGGGAPAMSAALKSSQVDLAIAGALQHMQQVATHVVSGKIIGVLDDTGGYEVLATNGITDLKQLKNKVFGISSYNGGDQYWAEAVLGKSGIGQNDVNWLPIGAPVARMAALAGGKIDATVIGVTQTSVPDSAKNRVRVLADEGDSGVPFIGGAIFARQGFLATDKPALQRFLAALGKGSDWVRAHPGDAIPACQDTGMKVTDCAAGIAGEMAEKYAFTWSPTTQVDAKGINAMIELYGQAIPQLKGMTLADFADSSLAGGGS